jgi:hypothetical protein
MRLGLANIIAKFAKNLKIEVHFLANSVEVFMMKKRRIFQHSKTTNPPLRDQIDLQHPLVVLADKIDWDAIDRVASASFSTGPGRPPLRLSPFGIMAPGLFAVMAPPEATKSMVRTGVKNA